MLLRLASSRLIGRPTLPSLPIVLREYRMVGNFEARGDPWALTGSFLPSHSARQRSVRLRHMVSALRLMCRSDAVVLLTIEAVGKVTRDDPTPPAIDAIPNASLTVASNDRYKTGWSSDFAFASAE